jgi:hypothetical protein
MGSDAQGEGEATKQQATTQNAYEAYNCQPIPTLRFFLPPLCLRVSVA